MIGVNDSYENYIKRHTEVPKTRDETYTPDGVYQRVFDLAAEILPSLHDAKIVRPFWPGADYENLDQYTPGSVVFDNPPFSKLSKIVKFYNSHNIKFVLFAPAQTIERLVYNEHCGAIMAEGEKCSVVFENKAKIKMCLLTNLTEDVYVLDVPFQIRKSHKRISKTYQPNEQKLFMLKGKQHIRRDQIIGINTNKYGCSLYFDFNVREE